MYRLKKSLGQHFLHDEGICRKIVEETGRHPYRQLLEIGPGGGALTKYLIRIPGISFKAVELDEEKIQFLHTKWPELQGHIVHASILDMAPPFEGHFDVVGNFPYNISTQILFKMLEWRQQADCITGMFQKEVAQRIAAAHGSKTYGVISVLLQAFYEVDYLFEVHEQCFTPPPKVKSAVIRLQLRTDIPPMRTEKSFFVLVKAAFNQRRKTLRNALKPLFDAETLQQPVFDKRAEQLSVAELAALTFNMKTT